MMERSSREGVSNCMDYQQRCRTTALPVLWKFKRALPLGRHFGLMCMEPAISLQTV